MATCRANADCGMRLRPGRTGVRQLRLDRRTVPGAAEVGAVPGRAADGRDEPARDRPARPLPPAAVDRPPAGRDPEPGRRCGVSLIRWQIPSDGNRLESRPQEPAEYRGNAS